MKKLVSIFMVFTLLLAFTACSNSTNSESENSQDSVSQAEQQSSVPSKKPESTIETPSKDSKPDKTETKSLVVYFSCTGNTKAVAEKIAGLTKADLYEIVPTDPYTYEDLNYNNNDCRANREMNDSSARPAIGSDTIDISVYDTVFIGYPIWWGTMPRIINTFLDTYDLSDKTIMPFCTSGGSGISKSVSDIKAEEPDADNPWTFTEFLDVLEKVKPVVEKKNGYALDMTFPVGEATIYYYAPFFWSNGGDMIDETGLIADGVFNSTENKKSIEYFKTILDNGYMSAVPIDKLFESGRAAFKFDGAWEVNTIYTSYPDIELGVAPYIVGDDWNGERYTPTGSWAFAATSKTEKIEGATELVKWMSGAESGSMLCQKTKSLPSTYKAFEENDIFETDENYKALYNQLSKYGHPRPKTPVYPQVSTSFQQTLENCVLSGLDIQSELDKSVERINAKLKRYTYNK